MSGGETILVPLDGSAFAETALPVAAGLARRLDVPVELISVVDPRVLEGTAHDVPLEAGMGLPPGGAAGHEVLEELEETLGGYLDTISGELGSRAGVDVRSEVRVGLVAETLEERVRAEPPALVVMATHGRGPVSRAWLGSVADALLRHSLAPILLVRPSDGPERDDEVDLSADVPLERILLPVDGSERAEKAIPAARRVGRGHDAPLYELVRVIPPLRRFTSSYLPQTVLDAGDVDAAVREEATEYLDALAARLGAGGLDVRTELVTGVGPAEGILRRAEESGADVIVLASRGRGRLSRLLLGSVADKVIRSTALPVLVVRPDDEE